MRRFLTLVAIITMATAQTTTAKEQAANVVPVHGAVLDGSGWRAVYDGLQDKGIDTTVVQLPLTSLEDDVAATQLAIDRQEGPTILVGSSYGGAIISVAGVNAKVVSLVYVAALQPDEGESVADLNAKWPMETHALDLGNGTMVVDPHWFHAEVAADLPEAETRFMANSQRPSAFGIFTAKMPRVAWREKPSYAVVARKDRTVDPNLQRFMYARSKAYTTEVEASHLPHISNPQAVINLIMRAVNQF